ncbi:MAG: Lantibiotic dehydratase domain protein [Myxococcales bacterium]|nr:Lantibiotic dehydratase domain protein [Myxococcales bacterium]
MSRWRSLPAYLVRSAGFAFQRLVPLRCTRSAAAADALEGASDRRLAVGQVFDTAVSEARYGTNPEFDDPAVRKAFSRHVKRARAFARQLSDAELPAESLAELTRVVPSLVPRIDELAQAHATWLQLRQAYADAFSEELEGARVAIRRMYGDEYLQEAVFLESGEAYARIQQLIATEGPRNSRARQRERLAMMYAQRFCAKNDTNSICGPHGVAYATDTDGAAPTSLQILAENAHRSTYFSHWAAQRLLDEAVRRAGPSVVTFRAHPTARLSGTSIAWCAMEHDATNLFRRRYGRTTLPVAGVRLIEALAVARTEQELHGLAAELELDIEELTAFLAQLVEAGMVVRGPTLAPGLFYPLRAAADEIERWPSSEVTTWALDEIAALEALVARFARAPLNERVALFGELEARFVAATGDPASRGEGKHYADRSLLHEDCSVDVRSNLGAHWDSLQATLPVLTAALELPLELARERVREWFRARFGEGTSVPALDVHRAFDEDRVLDTPAATPRAAAIEASLERVRGLMAEAVTAGAGGPALLSSTDVLAALAAVPTPGRAGYISADIMVRDGVRGDGALVLGEVHGFFWLPTCLLDVVPADERERVADQMRAAIRDMAHGRSTAECIFLHTQATDRRIPLASTDLQIVTHSDRPDALAFGDLDLRLDGDDFIYTRGDEEVVPLVAYAGYPFVLYTSRIAPLFDDFKERFFPDSLLPESLRSHDAPRLVIDDLVIRRRSWRRASGELLEALTATTESEMFRKAQALRRALGCDACVFVSVPGEPKPILLDFHNQFLIEALVNLLERQPATSVVKIGEMLPGPGELSAQGSDGARTSELRMGFYRV